LENKASNAPKTINCNFHNNLHEYFGQITPKSRNSQVTEITVNTNDGKKNRLII